MVKIVTVEEMRAIEQEADASGVSYDQMMDNAGRALADRVLALLEGQGTARIAVLVGSGNNGGDALVAGYLIAQESSHEVNFYLYKPRDESDRNYAAVTGAGLFTANAADDRRYRVLKNLLSTSHLVIDGILGIGLHLPVKGDLAKFLKTVKTTLQAAHQDRPQASYTCPAEPATWTTTAPYVVAVDCPSGLDCDTGALDENALFADETITFAGAKIGQVLFPGAEACGTLYVAGIGLPDKLSSRDHVTLEMPTAADIRALLPPVPANAHKGTFGKVLSITGSLNYTGAAALSAEAAYRAGAGLVTVGAPQIIVSVLAAQVPEATWLLLPHDMGVIAESAVEIVRKEMADYNALLMGPGWGREETTRNFLLAMLSPEKQEDRRHRIGFAPTTADEGEAKGEGEHNSLPPLVMDADGLNLLSELDNWWSLLPPKTVLTPHPGEMARLTGLARDEVNVRRLTLAPQKAAEWRCVVVLKGAFTVIAAPDGRTSVLPFAVPALATAGTGDVLAGTIAGLLAQGLAPFEAAVVAGYLHGLAGRMAAEEMGTSRSVTAQDVLNTLAEAVSVVEHAV